MVIIIIFSLLTSTTLASKLLSASVRILRGLIQSEWVRVTEWMIIIVMYELFFVLWCDLLSLLVVLVHVLLLSSYARIVIIMPCAKRWWRRTSHHHNKYYAHNIHFLSIHGNNNNYLDWVYRKPVYVGTLLLFVGKELKKYLCSNMKNWWILVRSSIIRQGLQTCTILWCMHIYLLSRNGHLKR